MNAYVLTILSAALAYLAGSIPFGYLMGLTRGVDIRTVGSGNIGATNVFRTLGKRLGVFTFALDVAKGVAAVAVVPQAVWSCAGAGAPPLGALVACAAAVMLGHAFPVFLGFRGGKGVATGLGLAIGPAPHSALLGLAVWIVVFAATRYVSVGSVLAALVVGAAPWWQRGLRGDLGPRGARRPQAPLEPRAPRARNREPLLLHGEAARRARAAARRARSGGEEGSLGWKPTRTGPA